VLLLLLILAGLTVWIGMEWLHYRHIQHLRRETEKREALHQEREAQANGHPRTGHVQHLGPR